MAEIKEKDAAIHRKMENIKLLNKQVSIRYFLPCIYVVC